MIAIPARPGACLRLTQIRQKAQCQGSFVVKHMDLLEEVNPKQSVLEDGDPEVILTLICCSAFNNSSQDERVMI
jgi:hypothetical protein